MVSVSAKKVKKKFHACVPLRELNCNNCNCFNFHFLTNVIILKLFSPLVVKCSSTKQDTYFSGGPLTIAEDFVNTLIGIVSVGIGCGEPKLPGIYTRVSEYSHWLQVSSP
jgi:secreted trypsin-like serine protease